MSPRPPQCKTRRTRQLVDRLAPFVVPVDDPPLRLVSAEPIRWWLAGWTAATGDRVDIVATGFGLSRAFLEDLLAGEIRRLSVEQAQAICRAVDLDAQQLWGRA